jgi:hypothetical protein
MTPRDHPMIITGRRSTESRPTSRERAGLVQPRCDFGWAIADHMRTDRVADALQTAAATRGSIAGVIFHSDHGSVYTSAPTPSSARNSG